MPGSPLNPFSSLVSDSLQGATLEVETAFSPRISINLLDTATGKPSALMRLLKPSIRVRHPAFGIDHQVEPYGSPSGSHGGKVLVAVGVVALVGLYLALRNA